MAWYGTRTARRWFVRLSCVAVTALPTAACGDDGEGGSVVPGGSRGVATSAGKAPTTTDATASTPPTIDCDTVQSCPEITVEGDPPAVLPGGQPSPLRGYADPSIRRDPGSGDLWMAYAWPSIHVGAGGERTTLVDAHLARSRDDGRTWQAVGSLWDADAAADPVTAARGWTDHEVPDLLPVTDDAGSTRWVAARLDLFVPAGQGLGQRPTSSFRIGVLVAPTPPELAAAEPVVLGSAATDPAWGVHVALHETDEALSGCTVWNEPALHYEKGTLYLGLRCLSITPSGVPDMAASSVEIFSTDPSGDPRSWRWRYAGRLAGHDEALELGGDALTQTHFARAGDASLLVFLTPDGWDGAAGGFVHHGVRVLEVPTLAAPRLARADDGRLVVRASLTASDLDPLGPGAAAYEPTAATGVVLVRREIERGVLVATMHDSRLHP